MTVMRAGFQVCYAVSKYGLLQYNKKCARVYVMDLPVYVVLIKQTNMAQLELNSAHNSLVIPFHSCYYT